MRQTKQQNNGPVRFLVVALAAVSFCFDASAFTSKAFVARPGYGVFPVSSISVPGQSRPRALNSLGASSKIEAVVDPLENSTELARPSALGASAEEGEGRKPPFTVTIEGDDQSYGNAIERTLAWVGAASVFGAGIWAFYGPEIGSEFFAGYLVEQSLSVDNLFVFLLLFEYFKVPQKYQDRVLNWGIYGAVVMRALMISIGAAALENFHEVLLIFASILLFSSFAFFFGDDKEEEEDVGENYIVQFSKGVINSTEKFDGNRFFTVIDGVRMATPMLICTIAVEISDVVFAVDSIPAVFGVTELPLIVFSSNMFAIMGLRSMYTILSKAASDLKYLEPAVAVVLGFIGSKMVAEYFDYHVPTAAALAVVASLLGVGVGASLWERKQEAAANGEPS